MSNWTSCTRTLRSRRDIENVDKQSVQLIVLVSMLPTVPGMLVLVEYSNDEIQPMVATALPALDWLSGRPACPRRPHCPRCPTHNTHTHNHTIAATAAVSAPGGAAGTQRSSGAEGDWRRRPVGEAGAGDYTGLSGVATPLTPRPCRQAAEPVGVARAGGNTGDAGGGNTPGSLVPRRWVEAAASRDEQFGEPL